MFKANWVNSLTFKLGGSLAIIACALGAMITVNIATFDSMRGDAAKMNQFGLGRAYFATMNDRAGDLFNADKTVRATARNRMKNLIRLNNDRFDILLNGDPSRSMQPVTNPGILADLRNTRHLWVQDIVPLLQQLLTAELSDSNQAQLSVLESRLKVASDNASKLVDDEEVVLAQRVANAKLYQYGFLGGSALVLGLVAFMVLGISRRAKVLVAATKRIADGDFKQKVTVKGGDEIAILGDAFNTMADNLQGLISSIAETASSLAAASAELLAGTTQQSASAQEQAAAVTQTVSTVDEVQQTSEQAAGRARTVAQSAQRAAEIGKAGRQAIEDSVAAMATVKAQTEQIAESILALAERAQVIGEIIASVNDIAEQTNLLALNAGIEAARAAEHGSGFAVVAREIKDLADQAKKATTQVREILGEIQKATNGAVIVTEEGSKSVMSTIKAVNQAGDTIRSLTTTVDEAASAAQQISASAGQQVTGIGQVKQAMRDINEATNQSLAATRQTEKAAQDLNALGAKLKKQLAA